MVRFKVRDLSKSFGGIKAVSGLSFDHHAGELLAVIGPNGAGKTTCFNILSGYTKPDSGSIKLDDEELRGLKPRVIWRKGIGRTFQITATFTSMTVRENVQMALLSAHRRTYDFWSRATRYAVADAERLLALVSMLDYAEQACSQLSYGDLKRLELAIALAHGPRLLLMDEPTAGMAPAERAALMVLTRKIVTQEKMSVLFTEHDMDVVFRHANRILVLDRGRLIAQGCGDEIRANPLVREVYLGRDLALGDLE